MSVVFYTYYTGMPAEICLAGSRLLIHNNTKNIILITNLAFNICHIIIYHYVGTQLKKNSKSQGASVLAFAPFWVPVSQV